MKIIGIDIETTGVDVNNGSVLELGAVIYNADKVSTISELNNSKKLTILVYHKVINNAQIEALKLNANLISEIAEYADEYGSYYIESRSFIQKIKDGDNHQVWLVDNDKVAFVFAKWLIENDAVELTNYCKKKYPTNESLLKQIDSLISYKKFDELTNLLKYSLKGITLAGKNIATFDVPYLRNNVPYFNDIIKIKHRMIDPSIIYTVASDESVPDLHNCMNRLGIKDHKTKHRAVNDVMDVLYLIYFHFKKTKFRTYLAIDVNTKKVVDKITRIEGDSDIESFIVEYMAPDNQYLVINELDLHKLAVIGRLDSFNCDLNNCNEKTDSETTDSDEIEYDDDTEYSGGIIWED